ncbi:efflux RND transporter periplasmic adaptor subunit [Roseibacillus ishigakijimensis]|uniref:Efflux RND transporter periplasmic adaptor subunit n=1 Tax=Roseibacillus ishigakijimensis TaxID=454146 RepID=A0A934RSN4_9BACT|nr:efflux RND transporter periplasmic adaptor subunit [Roseibacillus ishigakijimensis]MBK1834324.1 efflux RND transporter periplasmic adaptor subunit [Roseibacillus ishigakijimensis]
MRLRPIFPCSLFLTAITHFSPLSAALDAERAANTVILSETAVRNLGIETEIAMEATFESTVFALGRLQEIPANKATLSTRIPGRILSVDVFAGDSVEEGQVIGLLESRQPGSPPPTIKLIAPRGGLITQSHIQPGQPVEASEELLTIVDRSAMWAVARIPEKDAARLAPGSEARLHIPAAGEQTLTARLTRFGVQADPENGTVDGIFRIANPAGLLRPGLRVEFSLITQVRENVLSIPRSAIQGPPENRHVFVKDFELAHAFLKAPVVVGQWNDQSAEIVSGLFPGDEVVTTGSYSLGFAGGGDGPSLKEALDAAHGHEHNEDGSEMTESDDEHDHEHEEGGDDHAAETTSHSPLLLIWALAGTVGTFLWVQSLLKRRQA